MYHTLTIIIVVISWRLCCRRCCGSLSFPLSPAASAPSLGRFLIVRLLSVRLTFADNVASGVWVIGQIVRIVVIITVAVCR